LQQVEDPKQARGIVRREVVQVITPGMILEPEYLETSKNNYLAAICSWGGGYGLAYLDISTGDFKATQFSSLDMLKEELNRLEPSELLAPKSLSLHFNPKHIVLASQPDEAILDLEQAQEILKSHFDIPSLDVLGLKDWPAAAISAAWILHYAEQGQKTILPHITRLQTYTLDEFMVLDSVTFTHLEVFRRWHNSGRCLCANWSIT